jgi:hypothetical protein
MSVLDHIRNERWEDVDAFLDDLHAQQITELDKSILLTELAFHGRVDIVKRLIEFGTDLNVRFYKGACAVPGCDSPKARGDGRATTQFRAAAAEACVLGRQVARTICKGTDKSKSGENHEDEIKKAQKKFMDCMEKMKTCPL